MINTISLTTGESHETVQFNIIDRLNRRVSKKDITDVVRNGRNNAGGVFRVITYGNTNIKCKCNVVVIQEGAGLKDDPCRVVKVNVVPQTGRWIQWDGDEMKKFFHDSVARAVEDEILGLASEEVQSQQTHQQKQKSHTVP